jgi:hypothetical protein|tara:strand:- start:3526 stop:6573 length:3048 start_codon:yes stop_codon:yes gene_type:complete
MVEEIIPGVETAAGAATDGVVASVDSEALPAAVAGEGQAELFENASDLEPVQEGPVPVGTGQGPEVADGQNVEPFPIDGEPIPVTTEEGDEPVEIAGATRELLKAATKALKGEEGSAAGSARVTTQVEQLGDQLIITHADEQTARRFNAIFDLPADQRVPLLKPNLGTLGTKSLDDVTAGYVDALNIIFEEEARKMRRGTVSMDDMAATAMRNGFDEAFLEVMGRRVGDDIGPEKLFKAMWVFQHTAMALDDIAMQARITGSPEDKAAFLQMLTIAGRVTINAGAMASETGRTMAVLSNASKSGALNDIERLSNLPDLLERFGVSEDTVDDALAAYTALPKSTMRKRMGRNMFQKGMDVWAELYINALLSSPVTHMINITSNLIFGMFQLPERALAGVIGTLRTGSQVAAKKAAKRFLKTNILQGFDPNDRVFMGEMTAMLASRHQGLTDAMIAAKRGALKEQETFGAMSKIDTRERRAISTDYLNFDPESVIGKSVNTIGIITRFLGSRLLLAEDEFAKGIAYQAELYAQAHRRMAALTAEGMDADKVAQEGAAILAGRDAASVRTAQEGAQRLTFQGDLGKFAGKFNSIMAHPMAKILVPFYKTPTNIIKETLIRTPLGIVTPTGFWKDLRRGGAEADLALSRMTMGSTIFATIAMWGAGDESSPFILTGAGPEDKNAAAAWERLELKPHSLAWRQEDGTYESFDYSRLAPISGILAMASDYAQYSQYEGDDEKNLGDLAVISALGMYDVVKDLPMMQGLFDIVELVGSEYKGNREAVEATLEAISKRLTGAALTAVPGFAGSLTATVERVVNPRRSDTSLETDQLEGGAWARGFYKALNILKSRHPLFSNDVGVKLNMWAEEMSQCKNGLWCFFSPIRVLSSKHRAVDEEMVDLNLGLADISRTQKGIELGVEQKNKIIIEMNRIEHPSTTPGETWVLLDELNWTVKQDFYRRNQDGTDRGKGEKLDMLRSIRNGYLEEARDTIFGRSSDLQSKVRIRERNLKKFGKAQGEN